MADVRELIWQDASRSLFMSREAYMRALDDWQVEPLERDGEPAFVMLTKGPEFHIVAFRTGARFPMKEFLRRLRSIADEHGYVTTRTPLYDLEQLNLVAMPDEASGLQHEVNRRLGFVEIGRDACDIIYRLDRETLQRRDGAARPEKEACQQQPLSAP